MNIYEEHGAADRADYLDSLTEAYDVPASIVYVTAQLLGPDEDFDGLITTLEDYEMGIGRDVFGTEEDYDD